MEKTRSSDHGLGEAGVAFAEAKLTEGISRAPVHAPIPGKHQCFGKHLFNLLLECFEKQWGLFVNLSPVVEVV